MHTETTSRQRPIRAGVFSDVEAADRAVQILLEAGFARDHLIVVAADQSVRRHFAGLEREAPAGAHTPSAVLAGGTIGAALGGLAAIALVATGGVALLAAGGVALGAGGVVGGLVGAMMTRGLEKEVANYYDQAVAKGKILVAAEALPHDPDGSLVRAEKVLAQAGAEPLPLMEG